MTSRTPGIIPIYYLLAAAFVWAAAAIAQQKEAKPRHKFDHPVNYGLRSPQPASTLPKSGVAPQQAVPKPKTAAKTRLEALAPGEWRLMDGWELAESDQVIAAGGSLFDIGYDTRGWHNAVVPGTVLTSLVEAGIYPDPYYGLNNLAIPDDLCRKEWWYRIGFDAPDSRREKAWLHFDGINYRADVWLNGKKLGSMAGAFVEGNFDVTDLLKTHNVLAVKIYPPYNPGIPHEQSEAAGRGGNGGQLCFDGPTFLSSEGWDWIPGIRDRNIGIWQDVSLRYTGDVTVSSPRIITDLPLPDTSRTDITVMADVTNHASVTKQVMLTGTIQGGVRFETPVRLAPGETRTVTVTPAEAPQLSMRNPRLWWPNGYGSQELYDINLSVTDSGGVSDELTTRFGVREYSYELSVNSADGERRIEYSPTDGMGSGRIPFGSEPSAPKLREGVEVAELDSAAELPGVRFIETDGVAPYLVIRCNGERIFCRGGNWGMDDGMKRVSRQRLEPAFILHRDMGLNMIRNWTGETTEELFYALCDEYGMMVWNDFWISTEGVNQEPNDRPLFLENARQTVRRFRNHPSIAVWCPRNEGYAPTELNDSIVALLTREDGTRHYNPNSRYMNLRTSGPWHHLGDVAKYYRGIARGFSTELGAPSVPTAESMRKFIPESERWPMSDTWHYHDLHFGLKEYCGAIDRTLGTSESMEEFCRKAQIVNYNNYRAMFESWNEGMWRSTSGVLLWMSHPAWPSVQWQTYSWDFETPGAYFGGKKACEPVHVQVNPDSGMVTVLNTTLRRVKSPRLVMERFTPEGRRLYRREMKCGDIGPNSLADVARMPREDADSCVIERVTLSVGGKPVSVNDYVYAPSGDMRVLNSLAQAQIRAKVTGKSGQRRTVMLENTGEVTAVAVKLNLREADGTAVLPTLVSDGYFNLLPGERREVTIESPDFRGRTLHAEAFNLP